MAKFGIGQAVTRVEDQRFLTGQGRYVDDIVLPAMAHGVTVLSPHAHARIKRVDAGKAKAAPGVLAVLTGADVQAETFETRQGGASYGGALRFSIAGRRHPRAEGVDLAPEGSVLFSPQLHRAFRVVHGLPRASSPMT